MLKSAEKCRKCDKLVGFFQLQGAKRKWCGVFLEAMLFHEYGDRFIPCNMDGKVINLAILDLVAALKQEEHPWKSIAKQFETSVKDKNVFLTFFKKDCGKITNRPEVLNKLVSQYEEKTHDLDASKIAAQLLCDFYITNRKSMNYKGAQTISVLGANLENEDYSAVDDKFFINWASSKTPGSEYTPTDLLGLVNNNRAAKGLPKMQRNGEFTAFKERILALPGCNNVHWTAGRDTKLKIGVAPGVTNQQITTCNQVRELAQATLMRTADPNTPNSLQELFTCNFALTPDRHPVEDLLRIKEFKKEIRLLNAGTMMEEPTDEQLDNLLKDVPRGSQKKLRLKRKACYTAEQLMILDYRNTLKKICSILNTDNQEIPKNSVVPDQMVTQTTQTGFKIFNWQRPVLYGLFMTMLQEGKYEQWKEMSLDEFKINMKEEEFMDILTWSAWVAEEAFDHPYKEHSKQLVKPHTCINSMSVWKIISFAQRYHYRFKAPIIEGTGGSPSDKWRFSDVKSLRAGLPDHYVFSKLYGIPANVDFKPQELQFVWKSDHYTQGKKIGKKIRTYDEFGKLMDESIEYFKGFSKEDEKPIERTKHSFNWY